VRKAAVAFLAYYAILVAAGLYLSLPRFESPAVATPTPTPSPSATSSAIASAARPTSSATPAATTAGADGAVTMQVTRTTVPAEFRYLVLGGGDAFRLLVLDLNGGRATQVATARIATVPGARRDPLVAVSASADGRIVIVTFDVAEASDSLFVVRPESGEAKLLLRSEIRGAVVSADGGHIAIGRNDEDPALTGLWVGTPDGGMRRLVADDPSSTGSPPLPYAFSPDNGLLAFGIGLGETGWQATVISASSKEGRIDRSGGGPQIVGADTSGIGPAVGAEFRSGRELFVWSSATLLGGSSGADLYDLATKRSTTLYRPAAGIQLAAAAWRPKAAQYAIIERPESHVFVPLTAAWLRGQDGSARKLGDIASVVDLWWSRDGSRLFAVVGGDDSVGGVTDLLTGKGVMQFCKRGGGPPPAPCT
jgi:hypothetical protein